MSLRNPRTTTRRARELRDLETTGAPPIHPVLSKQSPEIQANCTRLAEMHQCDPERAWRYVLTTRDIVFLDIPNTIEFLLEHYQPKPWTQDPPSWIE